MTGKSSFRYSNSSFFYHLINWCTYLSFRFLKIFTKPKQSNGKASPLIITGLFRSGTTITSRIIKDLGYSAGPDNHLLKAIGSRKVLNPDGFLENHFCMDLSMYLFFKTESWGDSPPGKLSVEGITLKGKDDNEMVWFSLTKIHDDRISNVNKLKTQLQGSASNPQSYFNSNFSEKSFVKNPHIAVLFPYFKKLFPQSKVLVVFRNPFDAVNSAKKVSPLANYELFNSYYEEMCSQFKSGNKNIQFFSYDNLIQNTDTSLQQLSQFLNFQNLNFKCSYIQKKEIQGLTKSNEVPSSTIELYSFMMDNCINQ
jgi:hypothetical protein